MGLFDKIKDNAKAISVKAIEDVEENNGEVIIARPQNDQPSESYSSANNSSAEPTDEPVEVNPDEPFEQPETESKDKESTPPPEENKKSQPKSDSQDPEKENKDQPPTPQSSEPKSTDPKPKSTDKKESETKPEAPSKDKSEQKATKQTEAPSKPKNLAPSQPQTGPKNRIVDVAAPINQANDKPAIFARERSALAALASQRRLNGTVPFYVTNHMNFKTRVFINRIEYSGSFGKNVLPIELVAWVKLRSGGTGVIIETTEGKRVVMVVKTKDRLDFADAILKVQSMQPRRKEFKDTQTVRLDQLEKFSEGIDEIEKLAKLHDKGILSQEEFDLKKKQILGL